MFISTTHFSDRCIHLNGLLRWLPQSLTFDALGFLVMVKELGYLERVRDFRDLKDSKRTVVSSISREMCVRGLNVSIPSFLCVEQIQPCKSSNSYDVCFLKK